MKTSIAVGVVVLALGFCRSLFAAEPVLVVDRAVSNPRQPQAAVNEQGTIYIGFGAGESIYLAKSTDAGETYMPAVKVGDVSKLALGMRRGPRIAASNDNVVMTAISHETGDLSAWRSADGGQSWQGPVTVNDSPRAAREGLHGMAQGPDGQLFCVWLDMRNEGTQVWGASSADGGQTWSENRRVYASPSGTVCECCHPSVAFDSTGAIYVMWRNVVTGNRDMFAAVSRDGGTMFNTAVKLGVGSWTLNACPMDGGQLAAVGPGKVVTVWRRDKQLLKTVSGSRGEQPIAFGVQPWVAANDEGVWLAWVSQRGGDLWLATPNGKQPLKLHNNATDPVLASSLTGKGPVVAVWETGSKTNSRVMAVVVAK